MNLQQMEYIVALDTHRHFVKAAQSCGVSQPTLSTLINKLEEELDTVIFDRSAHPIRPTAIGEQIINQARVVLYNLSQLKELTLSERELNTGRLRLGVIPTVAPYILPKLFQEMRTSQPQIELQVSEQQTHIIVEQLRKAEESLYKETEIIASQMPTQHLWVLKEGHCMRNQIFNFCEGPSDYNGFYEAGSITTLVNIVDANGGYTIIPELHSALLHREQLENVREFAQPAPVREISLIIRRDYVRQRMINSLVDAVKQVIPETMIDARLKKFAVKL